LRFINFLLCSQLVLAKNVFLQSSQIWARSHTSLVHLSSGDSPFTDEEQLTSPQHPVGLANDYSCKTINVFEYQTLANQQLPQMARDYYASGAWDEITLRDNCAAFERYKLRPRMLVDVSHRDLSTQILGQSLQLPILIAPMAFQCLADPQGEIATAKAAAKLGSVMVLSTLATKSIEDVASVRNQTPQWFQLYVHRDRGLTKALVERAQAAGFQALCLTVDAPVLGKREKDTHNQFVLPPGMELANLATLTDLEIPSKPGESGLFAYFLEQLNPALTWADLEWLQSLSPLPLVVKGILRGDDAIRAVEHGAKAVIVSNHGGRQLDGRSHPSTP
jgi:4-hydroxymandelate oxidase